MTEYITKEKVLAQLERCARDPYHESHYIRDAAVNTIRRMEAADVVPVVYCGDCVWWTQQEASCQGRCALLGIYPTGAWYCANGAKTN